MPIVKGVFINCDDVGGSIRKIIAAGSEASPGARVGSSRASLYLLPLFAREGRSKPLWECLQSQTVFSLRGLSLEVCAAMASSTLPGEILSRVPASHLTKHLE